MRKQKAWQDMAERMEAFWQALRGWGRRFHGEEGTIAVSFILCLPIFLIVLAIVVQYALLVNARVMLDHTAEVAARAAMVCLPSDATAEGTASVLPKIRQAACMAAVAISPRAGGEASSEAVAVADALQRAGVELPGGYAARYTYAQEALEVRWPDGAYAAQPGHDIELTVRYRFLLTVPGASRFIGASGSVAGVSGRFLEIGTTVPVQVAHGREAGGP